MIGRGHHSPHASCMCGSTFSVHRLCWDQAYADRPRTHPPVRLITATFPRPAARGVPPANRPLGVKVQCSLVDGWTGASLTCKGAPDTLRADPPRSEPSVSTSGALTLRPAAASRPTYRAR